MFGTITEYSTSNNTSPHIQSSQLGYVEDEEIQREQHAKSERVSLVGGRETFDTSWGDRSPTLLSIASHKFPAGLHCR